MSNEKVATFANKTIVTNDMAPALRQNATKGEAILWRCLRDRRMGVKFRRQCPVGDYILDFYCHSLKLCIELDGGVHGEYGVVAHDMVRTKYLNHLGITVLRFSNVVVFQNVQGLLACIESLKVYPRFLPGYHCNELI